MFALDLGLAAVYPVSNVSSNYALVFQGGMLSVLVIFESGDVSAVETYFFQFKFCASLKLDPLLVSTTDDNTCPAATRAATVHYHSRRAAAARIIKHALDHI